jgi:hypothetical protein
MRTPAAALSLAALIALSTLFPSPARAEGDPLGAPQAKPGAAAPTETEIQTWIADLGSDRYEVREAAMAKLRAAGDATIPLLSKFKTEDVEVRLRIEQILAGDADDNQRHALQALGRVVFAETWWRRMDGDSDGNGAEDYWTRDFAGLHCARAKEGSDRTRLGADLARADASPAASYAQLEGGPPRPWHGYLFRAIRSDADGKPYVDPGAAPPAVKGAPAGACTNAARFAFCAYPARHGRDGRMTFVVNERNLVWQKDLGAGAQGVDVWPNPEDSASGWTECDWMSEVLGVTGQAFPKDPAAFRGRPAGVKVIVGPRAGDPPPAAPPAPGGGNPPEEGGGAELRIVPEEGDDGELPPIPPIPPAADKDR